MRFRPWHMLIFISILTLVAVWIDLPGTTGNVFGLKDNVDVHQGLDLQGGLQVLLQANPPGGGKVDSGALEGTRNTIERRVNGLGVSEPVIQTQNNNQIIVELPGVQDPEEAVRVLKETALLEIIDPQGQYLPEGTEVNTTLGNATAAGEATPEASPGASPVGSPEASPQASPVASPAANVSPTPTGPVYTTIVSGKDLKDAYPTRNNLGSIVVGFELKSGAASTFYDFTSTHIGQPMSIVLDKKVISSPTINGAISNQGIIEGMSAQEVNNLVVQLKAGALSVPLEVKSSRTVGPHPRPRLDRPKPYRRHHRTQHGRPLHDPLLSRARRTVGSSP